MFCQSFRSIYKFDCYILFFLFSCKSNLAFYFSPIIIHSIHVFTTNFFERGKDYELIWLHFVWFLADFFEIFSIYFFWAGNLNGVVIFELTPLHPGAIMGKSGKMKVPLSSKVHLPAFFQFLTDFSEILKNASFFKAIWMTHSNLHQRGHNG